jgi:hypothetical protein
VALTKDQVDELILYIEGTPHTELATFKADIDKGFGDELSRQRIELQNKRAAAQRELDEQDKALEHSAGKVGARVAARRGRPAGKSNGNGSSHSRYSD